MKKDKDVKKYQKLKKAARKKRRHEKRKKISRRKRLERRLNRLLTRYGKDILKTDKFVESDQYIQHGSMSVMQHSIHVAKYSLRLAKKLGIQCNRRDLVRGALLHDYFQYDWHSKEHCGLRNLHGFYHPGIALRNAEKDYELTKRQRDVIKKHMWPLTVIPPVCREAWIVTMADKYCSLMETLHLHRGGKTASFRSKKK